VRLKQRLNIKEWKGCLARSKLRLNIQEWKEIFGKVKTEVKYL